MKFCRRLWALGFLLIPLVFPGVSGAAAISVLTCTSTKTDATAATWQSNAFSPCTSAQQSWYLAPRDSDVYYKSQLYTRTESDALYYSKTASDALYYSRTQVDGLIPSMSSYYTKTQTDAAINAAILAYIAANPSSTNGQALLPDLTLAEGGTIAGAILGLWALAWGIRAVRRVLNEG